MKLFFSVLLLIFAGCATGQDSTKKRTQNKYERMPKEVRMIDSLLALTKEQEISYAKLILNYHQQLDSLSNVPVLGNNVNEKRTENLRTLYSSHNAAIRALLSKEQFDNYVNYQNAQQAKARERNNARSVAVKEL